MSETGVQIVLCTFPDIETARQIGTRIVERQLAKCVNLIPSVESIYEWEGKIERENEVLAVFKINGAKFDAFGTMLTACHPYDTPEILAVDAKAASQGYLDWVLG